jgi:hypothetical protein
MSSLVEIGRRRTSGTGDYLACLLDRVFLEDTEAGTRLARSVSSDRRAQRDSRFG